MPCSTSTKTDGRTPPPTFIPPKAHVPMEPGASRESGEGSERVNVTHLPQGDHNDMKEEDHLRCKIDRLKKDLEKGRVPTQEVRGGG